MARFKARKRLKIATLIAAVIAAAVPALALAWAQTYAASTYFNPDGIALSSFNSSLNYNEMYWQPPYDPGGQAGPHYGQVTLCNGTGTCYSPYRESSNGFVQDTRTISYGRGKCHAKASNIYAIYVYDCYVSN